MEIERLSGDYNRGYTQAIKDITEIFGYVNNEFAERKLNWKYKRIGELLALILRNREVFRERRNYFIRWNCVDKKLECVEEKRNGNTTF